MPGWVGIAWTFIQAGWQLFQWIKSHKTPAARAEAVAAFGVAHRELVSKPCTGVACPADTVSDKT